MWARRRFGASFSGLEIPFPGNGDRSRQRLGSNGELLRRKPEHLVLAGPLGRQVPEADNAHAMRQRREAIARREAGEALTDIARIFGALKHDQLTSQRSILGLKPTDRPERRNQHPQKEEEQRDHRGRRYVIPLPDHGRSFRHTQGINVQGGSHR